MKIKNGANTAYPLFGSSAVTARYLGESALEGFTQIQSFVPIARWDIWPGETIVEGSTFRPGLIAYSPNGIEKVVFTCNGTTYNVTDVATNPDSGQLEYFPEIDTTGMSALFQPIEVTAVVHDNNGEQISFDQTPIPFGAVDPQGASAIRPGEVSTPFRCVASSPSVVWIAPEGHVPADAGATKGTEANPYKYEGTGNSAVEQLVEAYRPSTTNYVEISTPLEIRMHSGTYGSLDLNVDSWNLNSHPITAQWAFVNTGATSQVVINRQINITQKSLVSFENVTFDASDPTGTGSEASWEMYIYKSSSQESIVVFRSCKINGYKSETVRINGIDINNWPRMVIASDLVINARAFFADCEVEHGRPNLPWSRSCRINKAAHDCTGGVFHVGLTLVDCSSINVPFASWSDIHMDNWQNFAAGGTISNVILKDWKLYRYYGQGPFFSGNTEEFKRVAIIDCDFGLDNTEGSESGIADGIFIPNPAVTVTDGSPYNGTGYAVDQYDGYAQGDPSTWTPADGYDNTLILTRQNEQRLNLAPGTSSNGVVQTQGKLTDFYIKGCTIFSRSLITQRDFTSAFDPTAILGIRVIFEDNFDENGKMFVPGTDFANSYDDRGTFKRLRVDPEFFASYSLEVPNLTSPYSQWEAAQTTKDGFISYYTTGTVYRTTTGLNENTQYPGT